MKLATHKMSLADSVKQAVDRGLNKAPVRKQYTAIKTAGSEATGETGATMRPSDEQLDKINKFTRRPVTADEVVAFETMSCNDLPDRDDDIFSNDCVKQFAALKEPFSSVGKSYMVSHDHKSSPKGRIFDVGTKSVDGTLFLTNQVYIPNTDANKEFIENLDFGINWAVSVGVQLEQSSCTIPGCDASYFMFGMWCSKGHDKGYWYDPNSDEKDDWGYPIPVDENAPGAVKCLRQFDSPRDFYELSQVYLGAQYFAELSKDPKLAGLVKAASAGVPIIGMSKSESQLIIPDTLPKRVQDAKESGVPLVVRNGVYRWLEDKLVYAFDPETDGDEVVCLGKPTEDAMEMFADADAAPNDPLDDAPASDDENTDPKAPSDGDPEPTNDPEPKENNEEMSAKAVRAAALKAKLPASVLELLVDTDETKENGLDLVLTSVSNLLSEKDARIAELEPKATLGEEYFKDLRAEAVSWFIKSKSDGDSDKEGADTTLIERLCDAAGDNPDLLKQLAEEYKSIAQQKFPQAVRRTSFPDDPNDATKRPEDVTDEPKPTDRVVSRLHG